MDVNECRCVNNTKLNRCCSSCSTESVKAPALSLISVGPCPRSVRKARLLPFLAPDSHLATYFQPLFNPHSATKQMVFTSEALIPQAWGVGNKEARRCDKVVNYKFETHHGAFTPEISACHLTYKNMTNAWNELEEDLTQMSDITI